MPEARPGTWKVQPGMSVAGAFRSWAVRPCLERLVFFLQLGVGLCVGGTAIDRRSCQRLYAGGLRCQFAKGRICEVPPVGFGKGNNRNCRGFRQKLHFAGSAFL